MGTTRHISLTSPGAGRHYASSSAHPAGVIVRGSAALTDKLKDPNYLPYCLMLASCGRLRRTGFGFECRHCGNKTNYDLTRFNGNVDVQYEPALEVA